MKRIFSILMTICILACMALPVMAAEPAAFPEGVYPTSIKLTLVDKNRNPLEGAVYGFYRGPDDQLLEELTSDRHGVIQTKQWPDNVSYYLKEHKPPVGWASFTDRYTFDPPGFCAPSYVEMTGFYQIPAQGQVKIIKTSAEGKPLAGVIFGIYAPDHKELGRLTTDADGLALSERLTYGDYYAKELTAPEGFLPLVESLPFRIEMDGSVVELPVINQREPGKTGLIQLVVQDAEGNTPLENVTFAVYQSADDTKICDLTTGKDGTVTGQPLDAADYYLLEQTPPQGYEKNSAKHPATVTAEKTTTVTVRYQRLPEPEPEPKPTTGTVTVKKVDAADSGKTLSGAVFSVYEDEGGKKAGELLTGKDGSASLTLPEGSYTLRETGAPDGYKLDTTPVSITLKGGDTKELTVKNSKTEPEKPSEPGTPAKPGTLRITKEDAESGNKLADAVFGVYRADNDRQIDTLTTNKNGTAQLSLPAGDYYLQELTAPKGYLLKKASIHFYLAEGTTRELTVKNIPEDKPQEYGILHLTKEDKETGKPLKNATFVVYDKENNRLEELTTGRDGTAELELPVGSYYVREITAPTGYRLDRKKVDFKINADKTTNLIVENQKDKSNGSTDTPDGDADEENNAPTGTLRLVKSAAGSGKRLSGAVFGVYEKTGDKKLFEITTDANGVALLDLPAGSYSLKELRAPSGYRLESARILFSIKSDSTTLAEVTNEPEGAGASADKPAAPSTPNTPVISIPQTGEPFPTLYYALAALFAVVAVACGVRAICLRKITA